MSDRRESGRSDTLRTYVRRLEERVRRRTGRAGAFPHRDWDLARRWHDAGIPVGLVLEILDARGKRPLHGLTSIARAVEEAWAVVRSGRLARAGAPEPGAAGGERGAPSDRLVAAIAAMDDGALRRALGEVADAFAGRPDAPGIDDALDRAIEIGSPAEVRSEVEAEVDRALAPHVGSMPPETLAATRRRAVLDRLRLRAGLRRRTDRERNDPIG